MLEKASQKHQIDNFTLEKFHLMKSAMMQVVSHNDWDRTGIYQLLNRLMLIFVPIPTVFVIYKYSVDKHLFHTFLDPVNSNNFYRKINKLEKSEQKELKEHAIEIFNTGYYIVAMRVVRKNSLKNKVLDYEYFSKDHYTRKILYNLFNEALLITHGFYVNFDINTYWQQKLDSIELSNSRRTQNRTRGISLANPLHIENKPTPMQAIEKGIINPCYRDSKKSPLVYSKHRLPNIAFFVRTYERSAIEKLGRYRKKYNYNVRLVLCPDQQKDFAFVLRKVFEENNNDWSDTTWRYCGKEYSHFADQELRQEFFELINTSGGIHRILNILKEPYGIHARSFVDPIFSVGIMNTRPSVFDGTFGLDKIVKGNWESGECEDDKLRIISLYYIFQLMTPEHVAPQNASCIVKPLRVSGSSWICMASFTDGYSEVSNHEDLSESEKIRHFSFLRNFHGYFEIFCRIGKSIRHKAKRSHLRTVRLIIFQACWENYVAEIDEIDVNAFLLTANDKFDSLSSLVPFKAVSLLGVEQNEHAQLHFRGDFDIPLQIALSQNNYYPATIDGEFLKEKEIKEAITRGIEMFDEALVALSYEQRSKSNIEH